jgi:hypothetical protein
MSYAYTMMFVSQNSTLMNVVAAPTRASVRGETEAYFESKLLTLARREILSACLEMALEYTAYQSRKRDALVYSEVLSLSNDVIWQ